MLSTRQITTPILSILLLCLVFLTSTQKISAQSCTPVGGGGVSWYPGEGNANDLLRAANGTPRGDTKFVPGKVGQAFDFDGVGDFADIPTQDVGSTFTVEFWFRPTSGVAFQSLIANDFASSNFGAIFFMGNRLEYRVSADFAGTTPTIPLNQWTHVAVTYDGNRARIYVDGVLYAEHTKIPIARRVQVRTACGSGRLSLRR